MTNADGIKSSTSHNPADSAVDLNRSFPQRNDYVAGSGHQVTETPRRESSVEGPQKAFDVQGVRVILGNAFKCYQMHGGRGDTGDKHPA